MKDLRVAIVQTSAGTDCVHNMQRVEELVRSADECDLVALPEVFACRGGDEDYRAVAQSLDGPLVGRMQALAREQCAWVVGTLCQRVGDRVYNAAVVLDRAGRLNCVYRKIHLFEARLADGQHIRESDVFSAGSIPQTFALEGWRVGLSICYDVRFPELYRRLSSSGSDLFLVPANFTQNTGKDHWDVLLRSRAIENQAYVIAPDQCGANPVTGILSHGHSMAVGPWGTVLAQAADQEEVLTVTLTASRLSAVRRHVPVLDHRRIDISI